MRKIYVVRVITGSDEPQVDVTVEHVGPFEYEEAALHYIRMHVETKTKHPLTGVMEVEIPEDVESPTSYIDNDLGVQHG